tara:strand:+ start:238 stop:984 length:747 start_codon:yes stop_codon:yes gene_type:complete
MKWSVIIPTLWKSPRIYNLLENLDKTPHVGEIILIDNAPDHTRYLPKLKKLKILSQRVNIFVNPAWNLGVSEASFPHIALCNDDIEFDTKLFSYFDVLKIEQTVFGCCAENFSPQSPSQTELRIEKGHNIYAGWGCLLFFNRYDFTPIPNKLKIYCGDDWIVHTFKNVKSFHWKIETEMSTSSNIPSLNEIAEKDKLNFSKLLKKRDYRRITILHQSQFGVYNPRSIAHFFFRQFKLFIINSRLSYRK